MDFPMKIYGFSPMDSWWNPLDFWDDSVQPGFVKDQVGSREALLENHGKFDDSLVPGLVNMTNS